MENKYELESEFSKTYYLIFRRFSTVTSLCCRITSSTNDHSSEGETGEGGDMEEQRKVES